MVITVITQKIYPGHRKVRFFDPGRPREMRASRSMGITRDRLIFFELLTGVDQ